MTGAWAKYSRWKETVRANGEGGGKAELRPEKHSIP